MKIRHRGIDNILSVVLLVSTLVWFRNSINVPQENDHIETAILYSSSVMQSGVHRMADVVTSVWDRYFWLVNVEQQNEKLLQENLHINEQILLMNNQKNDIAQLEKLLSFKQSISEKTIGARVLYSSLNTHFTVVQIAIEYDAELSHQIDVGFPVLSSDGIIGKIYKVYGNYSEVLLATDPRFSIDVFVERTGDRGILMGQGKDRAYISTMKYLENDKDIRKGDRLITTGVGTLFPKNIAVGEVIDVRIQEDTLFQEILVEPFAKFSLLDRVIVVIP